MVDSITGNQFATGFRGISDIAAKDDRSELGQDDFMELMTAQLQNQDPMKPMENGDFLAQIAQFSTVNGITELQQSFNKLSDSLVSSQSLQASNLVGRNVLAPTSIVNLEQAGSVEGKIELPAASNQVAVNVINQSGETIRRLELGPQASGPVSFKWDGLQDNGEFANKGKYFVFAEGAFNGGNEALETLVETEVENVTLNKSGGLTLGLKGLGEIDFSQIKQIF
ncbi:MAG: flagellar hook assembly protein FlgD [Gammaproteobacteria bacterium]